VHPALVTIQKKETVTVRISTRRHINVPRTKNSAAPDNESNETFTEQDVKVGTALADLVKPADKAEILGAIVDNRCLDLDDMVSNDATIRWIDYTSRDGVLIFRNTATLILREAVRLHLGDVRVSVGEAISNGTRYNIHSIPNVTKADCESIAKIMRDVVEKNERIEKVVVPLSEAKQIFSERGDTNTLKLIETTKWRRYLEVVRLGETVDLKHTPIAPTTGGIAPFELLPEDGGVLLRYPVRREPKTIEKIIPSPKLRIAYSETQAWLDSLGVRTIGQLNEKVLAGDADRLIRISEGLLEKKIAEVADQITKHSAGLRIIMIAGPSSAGKTTFSKRLNLQLQINGLQPVNLSTDDFYVNRDKTPRDDTGEYDFEHLEAIDIDFFNDTLQSVLKGERVQTPRYDFVSGSRVDKEKWHDLELKDGQVLVIEGIHALNPRLTQAVSASSKFGIFINAMTQLCVDDHTRFFTSDTRLLRRMVRDRKFRGYNAAQTIAIWPSVRRGEGRWIFPFSESADVLINTAMVHEQGVLRLYAERFLMEIPESDPAYATAIRLLTFLDNFVPIFHEAIPDTSIIREFIGGSAFKY